MLYPTHYSHRDCEKKHLSPEAARDCAVAKAKREEIFTVEDQSVNGVKVIVTRSKNGSSVNHSCSCMGAFFRAHDNESCPNRRSS